MKIDLNSNGVLIFNGERYAAWPEFRAINALRQGGLAACRHLTEALTADDLICWAWRKDISPAVIAAVVSYPLAHAELLSLAQLDPDRFMRIYGYCPALLPYAAAFWAFAHDASGIPPDRERKIRQSQMLCGRPRNIFPAVGVEPRTEFVRILSKLRPRQCEEFMVTGMRRLLRDRRAVRLLRHLPSINEEVLYLLDQPNPVYDFQILHLAATEPTFEDKRIRDLVWDIIDSRERKRVHPLWPFSGQIRSWRSLMQAWCRNKYGPRYWFPLPPITPPEEWAYGLSIVPLRTESAVREEAEIMRNCSADLCERIAVGDAYLYRLLEPERATVLLKKAQNGGWEIAEAKLEENAADVSPDTMNRLFEWLFDTPSTSAGNKKSL